MAQRILVVDDTLLVRKMVSDTLTKNNYRVDTTSGGQECLELIAKQKYDLVILDYFMPEINGLEVLRTIIHKGYNVPVVILTGEGSTEIAVQAMKLGALDYVVKSGNYLEAVLKVVKSNLISDAEAESGQKAEEEAGQKTGAGAASLVVKDRILVVDDSPLELEEIKKTLLASSYEVETGLNGEDCLKMLSEKKYTLVVIDYLMPGFNALAVLQEIINRRYEIPVIVVTGQGTEEIAVQAMKLGALDYIVKTDGYLKLLPEVIQRNLIIYRTNKEKELLEQKLLKKTLDLEERVQQLRALNEISRRMIEEGLDLGRTLAIIVSKVADLLNCRRVTIMLLNPEREYLTIASSIGFPEEEAKKVKVKIKEDISGCIADSGEPLLIQDIEKDPRFKKRNQEQYHTKSLMSIPLKNKKTIIGVINASNEKNNQVFTLEDRDILVTISYIVAIAIEKSKQHEEIKVAAATDGLTGLYNQRHFYIVLDTEIERAKRYNTDLCLLILDLDEFKKVNDEHGHLQGDLVLADLSRLLAESIRSSDILARYGGEEFAMILPHTNLTVAMQVGKRIREKVEKHTFSAIPRNIKLTISLGIACYKKGIQEKEFVELADKGLYKAKQKGKNACCVFNDNQL